MTRRPGGFHFLRNWDLEHFRCSSSEAPEGLSGAQSLPAAQPQAVWGAVPQRTQAAEPMKHTQEACPEHRRARPAGNTPLSQGALAEKGQSPGLGWAGLLRESQRNTQLRATSSGGSESLKPETPRRHLDFDPIMAPSTKLCLGPAPSGVPGLSCHTSPTQSPFQRQGLSGGGEGNLANKAL